MMALFGMFLLGFVSGVGILLAMAQGLIMIEEKYKREAEK